MNLKASIGKEVRIFSFFYDKGDKIPYNIFTIIEEIHPWMQDYDTFIKRNGKPFYVSESYKLESNKEGKLLLIIFKTTVTHEMVGDGKVPRIFWLTNS